MSSSPLLEGRVSEIIEFDLEMGYSSANGMNSETTGPEVCLAGAKNKKPANGISDASSESRLADVKTMSPDVKNTKYEASISNLKRGSRSLAKNTKSEAPHSEKESWGEMLRTAVSSPEPRLQVCTSTSKEEAEIAAKHQVLYVAGVMAPIPMLVAAATLKLFLGWWAVIAGAAVCAWILASSGMVVNQYGRSRLEQICARHMGHLGVLSASLLFSFFVFRAFFPDAVWALWVLIFLAFLGLGVPWVLGCLRADG